MNRKMFRKAVVWLISSILAFGAAGQAFAFEEGGGEEDNAAVHSGSAYYVDCSFSGQGDGSQQTPFSSLSEINAVQLQPGEAILFKRGTTCLGQFTPSGSGTENEPIIISAYGTGTAKPIINANGQTNAVLLKNMAYVQMSELELTAPGDNRTPRRGVYVLGENAGDLYGVVLQNLTVHDVRGQMPSTTGGGAASSSGKFGNASGGIIIESQGTSVPTAFHDIQILDNEVYSVDRQGIYFWSNWCKRPELSRWGTDCSAQWYPNTNVYVSGNQLSDIGGDGIVPKMTVGGLVEHNTLDGFNVRSKSYNAGMWTANSDDITFQFNRVSGGISTLDGMAFDIDHATNNIIFQYNLSHNNEGGFFLFCPDSSANTKNFIIRYNVSVNDRAQLFMQGCGGKIVNGKIYNNTMYIGDGLSPKVYAQNGAAIQNTQFFNNIVYKEGRGNVGWDLNSTALSMDHNLFYNISSIPGWATNSITADPLLMNPGHLDTRGYRLGVGSLAIGTGVLIGDNGGRDYYGNAVSAIDAPNIGAYEGDGVLATPEEGCMPSLKLDYDPNDTGNGKARVTATVSNPCVSSYNGLTLFVSVPSEIEAVPSAQAISTLLPNETKTITLDIINKTNKPFGVYPLEVTVSNAENEVLIRSQVYIQLITSNWDIVSIENFEDTAAGSAPNGWIVSGNTPPSVVTDGDNKVLKLSKSSTVNRSIWSFSQQSDAVKLSAKFKAAQKTMPLGIHYLDTAGNEVLKLSLNDLGTVSYTNNGSFVNTPVPYESNQWQQLEAIVDFDSSSYIVLLDGMQVGIGQLGPSKNPISQLRLQVPTNGTNGSYLVDEAAISVPGVQEASRLQAVLAGPSAVKSGSNFVLQYGIEQVQSLLTAQDLLVHYDSNLLEYAGADILIPGLQVVSEKSEPSGVLRIIAVSEGLANAISSDQPNMLELSFRAKPVETAETAQIQIASAVFGDAQGAEYEAETVSYEITVDTETDTGMIGDVNGDDKISIGDLALIAANYGKNSNSPDWQSIKAADINRDGKIDLADMVIVAQSLTE
ncbi:cohesin domain-containing protein [Paenibacillus sp. IITD108]|uniref:cohesin domain-containing protein n=1 Tax=Paenibacillus sp. IITD108 TaxID=3116649 RepID=UPI002F3F145B